MSRWSFLCERGHEQGVFRTDRQMEAARAEMSTCYCGAEAVPSELPEPRWRVGIIAVPFEAHYNVSIDRPVRSLHELREFQRRTLGEEGIELQDYEPGAIEKSTDWQEQGRATAEAQDAWHESTDGEEAELVDVASH